MVSRNAGWNMTDLKGEWLPQLLSQREEGLFSIFREGELADIPGCLSTAYNLSL
jgi:hypothetical protein